MSPPEAMPGNIFGCHSWGRGEVGEILLTGTQQVETGYHCILPCSEGRLQRGIIWPEVSVVLRLGNHTPELLPSAEEIKGATKHACPLFLGSTPVPGRSVREEASLC